MINRIQTLVGHGLIYQLLLLLPQITLTSMAIFIVIVIAIANPSEVIAAIPFLVLMGIYWLIRYRSEWTSG